MTAAFRAGTPLTAEREDIALPLVSARGLTKDFGGDRGLFGRAETPLRAVAEVSLDIARGEVLGVVGEFGLRQIDARAPAVAAHRTDRREHHVRRP